MDVTIVTPNATTLHTIMTFCSVDCVLLRFTRKLSTAIKNMMIQYKKLSTIQSLIYFHFIAITFKGFMRYEKKSSIKFFVQLK